MYKIAFAALALICTSVSTHAQNFTPDELARRTIERRAIEAVIWGMPAVNMELMFQAMKDANANFNQSFIGRGS